MPGPDSQEGAGKIERDVEDAARWGCTGARWS